MERRPVEVMFDRMCTGMVLLVSTAGICTIVGAGVSILLLLR